jgi:hypothetical protein
MLHQIATPTNKSAGLPEVQANWISDKDIRQLSSTMSNEAISLILLS